MRNKKSKVSTKINLVDVKCAVCCATFVMTPEQSGAYVPQQYVLRAGTMTAIQAGFLCPNCERLELKNRIVNK